MEWTAAIARAVINPRHGVYEAQDGHFMERTHLPLKLHLPASVTIGGCMSKEAIEQKEVIVYTGKTSKKNNPAIDILRKIWVRRRKNGLKMFKQYQYDKYD